MSTTPPDSPPPTAAFLPTTAPNSPLSGTSRMIPSLGLSPIRNPTVASTSNAQYSVQVDEDRDQLRSELKDRIRVIKKPADFWGPILSTASVPDATVAKIALLIREDVDHLCHLANGKNPVEDDMYAPLTRIFEAIKAANHAKEKETRYWKDHHTKYPGVDSEILISGLEAEGEPAVGTSIGADISIGTESGSRRFSKRRRLAKEATTHTPSAGSSDDDSKEDRSGDGEYKRKIPSKPGTVQRVFDTRKPDWILLDCDSAQRIPGTPLWRQIAVIFELKASRSFAPTKANPESSLIVQCTDYARLHLSLRPFQRFSINFSLCGNLFNCWLIDRTGVVISDTVDLATDEGVNIFIRALVQVTTNLTMHDLGMDPTVTLDAGHLGDFDIPQFAVKMPSGNTYTTRGPPIWQSSSIFGRGTVVWKVKARRTAIENSSTEPPHTSIQDTAIVEPADSPDLILKSAYRHPHRIAESKFYSAIEQAKHSGVAAFLEGGDVMHEGKELTTATHRHGLTPAAQDSIAHRLVLKSKGRRLSEFNTLLELLEAVLASVRGHETLFKYGIIHRDISIGNVFISDDPKATPGFLGDLDMAKVYDANKLSKLIGMEAAQKMIKDTSQGSVTGTAQFMAISLLDEHSTFHENKKLEGRRNPNPTTTTYMRFPSFPSSSTLISASLEDPRSMSEAKGNTQPEGDSGAGPQTEIDWELAARNDLESFIWVMFYAFCVKEMNSRPLTKGVNGRTWYCRNMFIPLFGGVSFQNTFQAHLSASRAIVDQQSRGKEIWKVDRIPELRYWDLLAVLMTHAKNGKLDHTKFQAILEYYIEQETNLVARSG